MASLILKMIIGIMKKRPQVNFLVGAGTDYVKQRAILASPKNQLPIPKGISFTADTMNGVPVEMAIPKKILGDGIILYIHGGGYVYGDAFTSRGYASVLADESGLRTVSVSYRIAPEHPFPAGLEDCYAVYVALLKKYPDSRIAFVGESGGGNFILAMTHMAKDRGVDLPCAILALSPNTTMAEDLPSRKANQATDIVLPVANIGDLLRAVYLCKNEDPHHPYISPLFGDYTGFPPMKVIADRGEVLFDDSVLLVKKAKEAGVIVEFQELEGTFHSFPSIGRVCPESNQILIETAAFIHEYCDK